MNLPNLPAGPEAALMFRNLSGSWVAWSCDGNVPTGAARRSSSLMTLRLTFRFPSLRTPQKRSVSLADAVAPLKVVPLRSRETSLARFGSILRQERVPGGRS